MAKIYLECADCETPILLFPEHFDVKTEDDILIIRRECEVCGCKNNEIIYLN